MTRRSQRGRCCRQHWRYWRLARRASWQRRTLLQQPTTTPTIAQRRQRWLLHAAEGGQRVLVLEPTTGRSWQLQHSSVRQPRCRCRAALRTMQADLVPNESARAFLDDTYPTSQLCRRGVPAAAPCARPTAHPAQSCKNRVWNAARIRPARLPNVLLAVYVHTKVTHDACVWRGLLQVGGCPITANRLG